MAWYLEVMNGPEQGLRVHLSDSTITIGRDTQTCDMALSDKDISRVHARVNLHNRDAVYMEDAGSTNGTYINDTKITSPVKISPEDSIRLGNTRLSLQLLSSAEKAIKQEVPNAEINIGREYTNNLIIDDIKVSRKHARIEIIASNCYLTDLNSSSGTYLNGTKIIGKVALAPSSWIQIGGLNYFFDGNNLITEQGDIVAGFIQQSSLINRSLSISKALLAPFDGNSILKLLLGSVFLVIPVIGYFLSCGYLYSTFKNGVTGHISLPNWERWGDMFLKGINLYLIRIAYLLIPVLLIITYYLLSILHPQPPYSIINLLPILMIIFYSVGTFFLPMGVAFYAYSGNLKDAFHFATITQCIRLCFRHYLGIYVLIAVLWILVVGLSYIPYIGLIFAVIGSFYAFVVSALLFGELFRLCRT